MTDQADAVERSRTLAARPDGVWAVLGDVRRMPEWSEELEGIEVLEGDGRSVGSRFRGSNRQGARSWTMTCVIDAYDSERRLAEVVEN